MQGGARQRECMRGLFSGRPPYWSARFFSVFVATPVERPGRVSPLSIDRDYPGLQIRAVPVR